MNPVDLHTVADLIARHHTLGLYCHHCDRWTEAPLEQLAQDGWGRTPIVKLRFRCAICGGPAQRQLRPPAMPAAQGRTGWVTPTLLLRFWRRNSWNIRRGTSGEIFNKSNNKLSRFRP